MHIVMVSAEITPVAKVGGLADVITGLAKDLAAKGHQVEVMLPMYHCLRYELIQDLHEVYHELWVPEFKEWLPEKVFSGTVESIKCFFFTGGLRFHRDSIYGYDDDLFRFAHFNRAVLEFLLKTGRKPDIIHAHDWQTGLIAPIFCDLYESQGLAETKTVFTLHNIEHQGKCWYGEQLLDSIGLDYANYFSFDRLQDNLDHNMINLLKAGIVYSNFVTTVSPTYCNEIKTKVGGKGLEATLCAHAGKLGGVLNGLDYAFWNPQTDPALELNYNCGEFTKKYANKDALRKRLNMPNEYRPLLGCVSRLVPQKGLSLIKHAILHSLRRGGQFVLLGSSPEKSINDDFAELKHALRDNNQVRFILGYDEDLAHQIYAGADMLLVPSLFEPCGLTQLIALRYGTVPLVRNTGGLADTVFDVEYSGGELASKNGFVFTDQNPEGVESVINRSFDCWFLQGEKFSNLARNCMNFDYSWSRSSRDYLNIYNFITCSRH